MLSYAESPELLMLFSLRTVVGQKKRKENLLIFCLSSGIIFVFLVVMHLPLAYIHCHKSSKVDAFCTCYLMTLFCPDTKTLTVE